jgi:molybdate transport system substrate-binding protein
MMRRLAAVGAVALMAVAAISACSSTKTTTLTVYAASSLTGSFTQLGHAFEQAHPHTKVVFDFGASSALATSITNGAPADVFASAAVKNMQSVLSAADASTSANFANNVLEIAVPPGNPKHIATLADLAGPGVKVAECDPAVPCGAVATKVLANAGVTVTAVSREADVKSTLAKVQLGEVDAGLVYVTDVKAAGSKVVGIAIPASVNANTEYPIAVLTHSKHTDLAQQFVDLVTSAAGQAVLREAGFEAA